MTTTTTTPRALPAGGPPALHAALVSARTDAMRTRAELAAEQARTARLLTDLAEADARAP